MGNDKNPDITVVIPAYNVESYIERCARSVLEGTFFMQADKKPEIIIVNDGSTDRTGDICDVLAKESEAVKVIHQKHQGPGAARNAGIANANGTYLIFLDGDDVLEPETLTKLYRTMEEEKLDALFFGAVEVEEATGRIRTETNYNRPGMTQEIMPGPQLFAEMIKSRNYIGCSVLCMARLAIYKENALQFVPDMLHEDQVFTPQIFFAAGRAAYRNALYYHRYLRAGSIMQTTSPETEAENYSRVVEELDKFAGRTPMEEEVKQCVYRHITGFVKTAMLHYCRIRKPDQKQRMYYKKMKKMCHRAEISVSRKYRIYLRLVAMENIPVLGNLIRKTGIVRN